ncbi:MAG: chromate transporter [Proteobacteria bacterium]|nr:chromate transporter [Pseudomonadota bacterium]
MTIESSGDAPLRTVGKAELFLGFLKIGLLGFGGIAPWARHVIVEERRWLSEKEFASVLGVGQILPGPNTMNAAVLIGDRFQGVIGVLLCLVGQMALPLVIVTTLGIAYERFASVPEVQAGLVGAAAGAAGLVLGTAIKMVRRLKPTPPALAISLLAFAAVGIMQWPLPLVVVVLVPLAVAAAAMEGRA